MKNYISFVNDHSGSMLSLAFAACKDFNANIMAIKNAASREMLDTVVSVAEVGSDPKNPLPIVVSNPHVLKEKSNWLAFGGTPLYSVTHKLIKMLRDLPDANKEDVSFLVIMTTDGEATDPNERHALKEAMKPLLATGRWTFVVRAPKNMGNAYRAHLQDLGIPVGNIQYWDTTEAGMAVSTQQTTKAMDGYFRARSSGAKSTSAFYADASQVNVAALEDISKKVSLYVVPGEDNGIEIRPFILRHRMEYLKGAAFYQLTKTESRVSYTKQVLVRDRATGKIFAGQQARDMIGLPRDRNARLHPGDHKNFDLFIQSESVNRKLVGGTGVIYWKEIGVPFTQAELDKYTTPAKAVAATAQGPVVLPVVPVSTTPTKSPIPVKPRFIYFETREEARRHVNKHPKLLQSDIVNQGKNAPKGKRWAVPNI